MKIVAVISVLGLLIVTLGTIFLSLIEKGRETPVPFFFALGGLTTIFLICRYLMRMIQPASKRVVSRGSMRPAVAPLPVGRAATNRQLSEAAPYESIVEERTKQFEGDR